MASIAGEEFHSHTDVEEATAFHSVFENSLALAREVTAVSGLRY